MLEWKGKKHSIFMPCGVVESSRTCLKEFRSTSPKRTTPLRDAVTVRTVKEGQAAAIRRVRVDLKVEGIGCDRKSSISDSENKGMALRLLPFYPEFPALWPFTSLAPSGSFGDLP